MKKLISLALSLTLLLAIALPVHAAEDLILVGGEDYVETQDTVPADYGEPNYDWIAPLTGEEEEWSWEQYEAEMAAERQLAIDAKKAELGGVPGELGVMVDGTYLNFGGYQPMAKDNALYAPRDILLEAMDQPVPEPADHEAYVPVRAAAEAAGYLVMWDAQFETAVLIDKQGMVDAMDGKLTILNGLLTREMNLVKEKGAIRGALDMDATVTLFNSIDGDETFSMAADMDFHSSQMAGSMDVAMDLTELRALAEPYLTRLTDYGAELPEEVSQILDLLGEIHVSMRFDMETGKFFFQMPLLAGFVPGYGAEDWILLDMSDYLDDIETLAAQYTFTVGAMLYEIASANYSEYYYGYGYDVDMTTPVFLYDGVMEVAEQVMLLAGDDGFVEENGAKVLRLDADDLDSLFGEALESIYGSALSTSFLLKEFSFELTVRPDFTYDFSFVLRPEVSILSLSVLDFRIAMDATCGEDEMVMTVEFHYKNVMKVNVIFTEYWEATADPASTVPPEGAKVVDYSELLMSSMYSDTAYITNFE